MITTEATLAEYVNGNVTVRLFSDGTKVRRFNGDARPEFAESVDLKITDHCDAGCPWCHEKSTRRGIHAPVERVLEIIGGFCPGAELAIGGGNPLDHPHLTEILLEARRHGLFPNLTVNSVHAHRGEAVHAIKLFRELGCLFGLGVSYRKDEWASVGASGVLDSNTVLHLIAGIDSRDDFVRTLRDGQKKFLILGYKRFGFGAKCDEESIEGNLARLRYWLPSMLSQPGVIVSFDNLAINQLWVRSLLGEEVWRQSYMGDDGTFTFYIDAVRDEFAVSSTSPRIPRDGRSVREMFAVIREARSDDQRRTAALFPGEVTK